MRQDPQRIQRCPCLTRDLVDQGACGCGIDVYEPPGLLQFDRDGDQTLLGTVVQLALDSAAIGCSGQYQPPSRRPEQLQCARDGSALDDPDQLVDVDGLGEIAVEPDVEEALAVASHRLRGHRDHGDRGGSRVVP